MQDTTSFLITGLLLGLSAGFAPGPLLTLVISETLRHGVRAGVLVALAPVVTDLPIIVITLTLLTMVADQQWVLGVLSLCGALVVAAMAVDVLRAAPSADETPSAAPRSLLKGVLANALSPHPYLFWIGVGGPLLFKASRVGTATAALFVAGFYVTLVGAKVVLAIVTGRSRAFIDGDVYRFVLRLLGGLLLVLALVLVRDGLRLIGVWNT